MQASLPAGRYTTSEGRRIGSQAGEQAGEQQGKHASWQAAGWQGVEIVEFGRATHQAGCKIGCINVHSSVPFFSRVELNESTRWLSLEN